jgi:Holliday junction resolvase RusA-like endonuclease
MKIKFSVDGQPLSKSNNLNFGKGRAFIPAKYKDYESRIREAARDVFHGDPIVGPVKMTIQLWFKDRRIRDCQNYPKTICDALNDIVYLDDSQIVELYVTKLKRDEPGLDVTVEALEPDDRYPLKRQS